MTPWGSHAFLFLTICLCTWLIGQQECYIIQWTNQRMYIINEDWHFQSPILIGWTCEHFMILTNYKPCLKAIMPWVKLPALNNLSLLVLFLQSSIHEEEGLDENDSSWPPDKVSSGSDAQTTSPATSGELNTTPRKKKCKWTTKLGYYLYTRAMCLFRMLWLVMECTWLNSMTILGSLCPVILKSAVIFLIRSLLFTGTWTCVSHILGMRLKSPWLNTILTSDISSVASLNLSQVFP